MAVQKLMKAAVLEAHGAALRVAPVAVHRSGVEKYGSSGVLASSADRGWSGLSAQLRTHSNGVIAWKNTQPDTEICVNIRGNRSVITRQGGGIFDRTVAERGTIWLCPAGLQEDYIDISNPVPGILHIYLPPSHCSPISLGVDLDKSVIASLRYESGFQDPLLAEMLKGMNGDCRLSQDTFRSSDCTTGSVACSRRPRPHLAEGHSPERNSRPAQEHNRGANNKDNNMARDRNSKVPPTRHRAALRRQVLRPGEHPIPNLHPSIARARSC